MDDPNLGFPQFYFCGSFIIIPCASSVLQLFYKKDLNFVDDKLPMKTVKFTSLENLYLYVIISF